MKYGYFIGTVSPILQYLIDIIFNFVIICIIFFYYFIMDNEKQI